MRQPRRAGNGPRRSVYRDQRGMALVFVGMGLLAFMSASMLAIDVGMFMVARTQAQTAADAGALAGAVALVFDDFDDRSASGPAVQNAVVVAQSNQVMRQAVSVTPADVTFPTQERIRRRSGPSSPPRADPRPGGVASCFSPFNVKASGSCWP